MSEENILISTRNLTKRFGSKEVLRGIDCDIKVGEKVAIIGPSGSGKSTFLRCLNLLEIPSGGTVTVDGEVLFESAMVEKGDALNAIKKQLADLRSGEYSEEVQTHREEAEQVKADIKRAREELQEAKTKVKLLTVKLKRKSAASGAATAAGENGEVPAKSLSEGDTSVEAELERASTAIPAQRALIAELKQKLAGINAKITQKKREARGMADADEMQRLSLAKKEAAQAFCEA